MNDRHRYRAWLKLYNTMRDVFGYDVNHVYIDGEKGQEYIVPPEHDEVILLQCTGLKDKTGRLIFEGDVVKYRHTDGENTNTTEIIYSRYGWALKNTALPFEIFAKAEIEIIGDIYTNPELVGAEK